MGYPDNTKRWNIGDLVIHKADAKQPHMLMRVISYTRDGLVRSRYVNLTDRRKSIVYLNDLSNLLDPADFNIPLLEME